MEPKYLINFTEIYIVRSSQKQLGEEIYLLKIISHNVYQMFY